MLGIVPVEDGAKAKTFYFRHLVPCPEPLVLDSEAPPAEKLGGASY